MFNNNYDKETIFKIIKLGKPQFTFGIFLYFCAGAFLAILLNGEFVLNKFIFGYLVIFLASMAIHYGNDYFDYELDKMGTPTPFTGGSGILVENPELRGISKNLSIMFICLSLIAGVIFTFFYSYPLSFLLYILLGNFLVWFYAAPPIKLSYRRLGEFANTFNGFLLPGMGYFVVMGTLDLNFLIFAIPLLFLQLIFTVGVGIPDLEGDKIGGKITWVVARGRKFGFNLMALSGFMLAISFLIIPYTNLFPASINFRVLTLISLLPLSFAVIGLIKHPVEKEPATKIATMNVAMVFAALILIDSYLAYIII